MAVIVSAFAGNASHFRFNEAHMDQVLQQVEAAEKYVREHPGLTYQGLHQDLRVNLSESPLISAGQPEKALGIPSFCWGACCGLAGLAIVYFVTENKEETQKALWGCVASTVIYLVLYFAGILSTAATTY